MVAEVGNELKPTRSISRVAFGAENRSAVPSRWKSQTATTSWNDSMTSHARAPVTAICPGQ